MDVAREGSGGEHLWCSLAPIPGQQVAQPPTIGMINDPGQHVNQPGSRIDVVYLAVHTEAFRPADLFQVAAPATNYVGSSASRFDEIARDGHPFRRLRGYGGQSLSSACAASAESRQGT